MISTEAHLLRVAQYCTKYPNYVNQQLIRSIRQHGDKLSGDSGKSEIGAFLVLMESP